MDAFHHKTVNSNNYVFTNTKFIFFDLVTQFQLAINDCELTNTISKFIFFDLITQFQLAIHLI